MYAKLEPGLPISGADKDEQQQFLPAPGRVAIGASWLRVAATPFPVFFFFLPQHLVRFSSSRCGVCGIANSGQVVTGRTKEWSPSVWSEARARFNCARNEVVRPCGAVDKSNYFAVALLFGSIISVCPY